MAIQDIFLAPNLAVKYTGISWTEEEMIYAANKLEEFYAEGLTNVQTPCQFLVLDRAPSGISNDEGMKSFLSKSIGKRFDEEGVPSVPLKAFTLNLDPQELAAKMHQLMTDPESLMKLVNERLGFSSPEEFKEKMKEIWDSGDIARMAEIVNSTLGDSGPDFDREVPMAEFITEGFMILRGPSIKQILGVFGPLMHKTQALVAIYSKDSFCLCSPPSVQALIQRENSITLERDEMLRHLAESTGGSAYKSDSDHVEDFLSTLHL